jgi:hypothetical protein
MKELFTNTRLKKIVNVYQLQYTNGPAPGLGDYLRGCVCLYQICNYLDIEFEMVINHPMSKYLINQQNSSQNIDYNSIEFYKDNNFLPLDEKKFTTKSDTFFRDFMMYLNSKDTEILYLFSNAFPIWKHGSEAITTIRYNICPSNEMINYVNQTLNQLNMPLGGYNIIHIRSGDQHLLNGQKMKYEKFRKIIYILEKNTKNDKRYIVLSDNKNLKNYLSKYPRFSVYNKEITHLGENGAKSDHGIKNTLLDFFIMSRSSRIMSITAYQHGSGFSEWCSKIYNIPYKLLKI